jgi:hypothetical protein
VNDGANIPPRVEVHPWGPGVKSRMALSTQDYPEECKNITITWIPRKLFVELGAYIVMLL